MTVLRAKLHEAIKVARTRIQSREEENILELPPKDRSCRPSPSVLLVRRAGDRTPDGQVQCEGHDECWLPLDAAGCKSDIFSSRSSIGADLPALWQRNNGDDAFGFVPLFL
jgi:hypothetical protein